METQKLSENFLSAKKNNHALFWSLFSILVCLAMSHLYWNFYSQWGELLEASPVKVFEHHEYWRLFTTSFIHGDMSHLLANSYMLFIIGYFVNYHFGTVTYPILGFIVGIFINLVVIADFSRDITLVGASGIVYYLWGHWLVLYILIQRHIPLTRRLMKTVAISIVILVPGEFKPQTSYYAHAIGLLFGVLSGFAYFLRYRHKYQSYEKWESIVEPVNYELEYEALNYIPAETVAEKQIH